MKRRRLRFHRAAGDEAAAAARWYEERQEGLGEEFLLDLERGVAKIFEAPERWAVHSDDQRARRIVLERFPFSLVYLIRAVELVVIAVAHDRRRPGYWRERLQ